jgi:hypothetical protein
MINCGDLADKALAQELISSGPTVEPYFMLSNLEVQRRNMAKASEMLQQAFDINKSDPRVWSAIGSSK